MREVGGFVDRSYQFFPSSTSTQCKCNDKCCLPVSFHILLKWMTNEKPYRSGIYLEKAHCVVILSMLLWFHSWCFSRCSFRASCCCCYFCSRQHLIRFWHFSGLVFISFFDTLTTRMANKNANGKLKSHTFSLSPCDWLSIRNWRCHPVKQFHWK